MGYLVLVGYTNRDWRWSPSGSAWRPLWLRSAYPISGLFGFFFQPEQCFSLTTFQPEQYFSAKIQQAERGRYERCGCVEVVFPPFTAIAPI